MLSTLRTLLPYLLRYRWRYAGGLTALLFRGVLAAGVPLLIGRAVDQLAAGEQEAAVNSMLLALGIAAGKGIAQYAMRWILITISRDIEYDLRNDISAHLVTLDRTFYERYRTGDLMARVTNDLAQVRSLLGPGLMYTAEIGVVIATVLSIMAWTDWLLTLVIFAPMPLISLAVGHFGRRTHEQFQTVQKRFSGISVRVQEHLAGLRMLRAYNQGPAEVGRFAAANADYVEASLGLVRIWRSFYPLLELLVGLTGISLLGFGSWRVLQGAMTVGTFTMFIYFLAMLAWPMIGMGVVVNITQRGIASLGRLNELLNHRPRIADAPGVLGSQVHIRGSIKWQSVSVQYPRATGYAVRDVSLSVLEGMSLAVIGPVGSGKSTLASLVPRLYDPTHGELMIDGVDVRQLPLEALRKQVGYVSQETFLFSRSIADNIRLGRPDASMEEVAEAARLALLDTDEDNFPDGLDTLVGERGITLSGGQKQRVAMARALLCDPAIVVLDDSTSSLDAETEHVLLERMRRATRERTLLIVTHRVSSARLADRVAVMDAGRIVDIGSHRTLLARGGLYARIHERQRIEEELAKP
ncbi:MAG: ABC transporter ATP-binding protein [Acidobacteriia bacterium]|nr:ABC transporter ATP-binding protein [Terriglobia bacterium]MYK12317.1 ABC transporter ATP-binding protein [Terriglobia bacterium]